MTTNSGFDFSEILSHAMPVTDRQLGWVLRSEYVAHAIGMEPAALVEMSKQLLNPKRRSPDFYEGKHFVVAEGTEEILWTKPGCVKLGYKLKGAQIAAFRDACEFYELPSEVDLVAAAEAASAENELARNLAEGIADQLIWEIMERQLPMAMIRRIQQITQNPTPEQQNRLEGAFKNFMPLMGAAVLGGALKYATDSVTVPLRQPIRLAPVGTTVIQGNFASNGNGNGNEAQNHG